MFKKEDKKSRKVRGAHLERTCAYGVIREDRTCTGCADFCVAHRTCAVLTEGH